MEAPRSRKDVQRLNGRLAVLNRFISKSSDRSLPFFKALSGGGRLEWTSEFESAFAELKAYLGSPELLSTPIPREPLYIYLGVSNSVVSSALIREEDRVQRPAYYVSKTLLDVENQYSHIEKLIYALLISARKLRPYFQAHTIIVPTAHSLRSVLYKPETSGRLAK